MYVLYETEDPVCKGAWVWEMLLVYVEGYASGGCVSVGRGADAEDGEFEGDGEGED